MSNQISRKEKKSQMEGKPSKPYAFYGFIAFVVLILPVVYSPKTMDLDMMPRVFVLSLFLMFFAFLFLISRRLRPRSLAIFRRSIFVVFGLWLLISVITLLLSTNPIEGLYDIIKVFFTITITAYGAMLFIDKENWLEELVKIVVISAIVTSIVGFVQYYLWVLNATDELMPDGRKVIYRVVGVMAHKNLYSLSLFMMLPFVAYGIFTLKRYWRILAVIAAVFVLALIFILQTRAVWVGTMVASALTVVVLIIFSGKLGIPRQWRYGLIVLTLLGVIAIGGAILLAGSGSQNQYIKQLRSITNPKSQQNIHRINIWKTTVEMIQDKPIFGFGPNNWKLHAGYYFKGRFFLEDQINWQRPHNDFLWIFAEKGIFGILLYLAIFILTIFYLIRTIIDDTTKNNKLMSLFLMFGIFGYLAASFFDFPYDRVFHQAFLGIFFACSLALYNRSSSLSPVAINGVFITLPLIFIFAFGAYYGYWASQQESHLKKARAELRIINQIIPRIHTLPENQQKNASATVQLKWKEVLKHAQNSQFLFKNLDPQANPVSYYIGLAYLNLNDLKNGLKYCLIAYDKHPGSIKALNSLGAVYFNLNKLKEAEKYLLMSMEIFPSHDALQNLSATYYKQERYQEAYDLLKNAPKDIVSPQLENNLKAIEIMLKEKEKAKSTEPKQLAPKEN
jgi:O-antigen ligase